MYVKCLMGEGGIMGKGVIEKGVLLLFRKMQVMSSKLLVCG